MSIATNEGTPNEKFQQSQDDDAPVSGIPMSWKQGQGLFKRQKAVEALTRDVGNVLILFYQTLLVDPNSETWHRRLNDRRDEFEKLRKRLAL